MVPVPIAYSMSLPKSSTAVVLFQLSCSWILKMCLETCLQVEMTHQGQPNSSLSTFEHKLTLNLCSVAPINSFASSSVIVEFSFPESSGVVPHGTIATFKPLVC